MDPLGLKRRSEEAILAAGGQVCDWLPTLQETTPRPAAEVAERALAIYGLLQLFFGAPNPVIRTWLECNGLRSSLSEAESELLGSDEPLSETERRDVYWYIEALWALVWVGSMIDSIPPTERVGNTLASLLPSIKANEDKAEFLAGFAIRPNQELRPIGMLNINPGTSRSQLHRARLLLRGKLQ